MKSERPGTRSWPPFRTPRGMRRKSRGWTVAEIAAAWPALTRIALVINGKPESIDIAPWTTLLDVLRHHLGLTGAKKGCDYGQWGACTVLVDDRRTNSCLTLAIMMDGARVTTVEGLAEEATLHPVQAAFLEHDAFQRGYCTPGQICSAVGLIREGRAHAADQIRELKSGNICRCGAYPTSSRRFRRRCRRSKGGLSGEPLLLV